MFPAFYQIFESFFAESLHNPEKKCIFAHDFVLYIILPMGRILSIDYGRKRTGLAVTDPMQIIANGLQTLPTHQLEAFLRDYIPREGVERVVVGLPRQMNGQMSESWQYIQPFLNRLHNIMPEMPVELVDERFTSKLASQTILQSGIGKQRRKEDKGLIDEVSATIILQSYMDNSQMPGYRHLIWPFEMPV